jgi:AraC-like DNA-binding protein
VLNQWNNSPPRAIVNRKGDRTGGLTNENYDALIRFATEYADRIGGFASSRDEPIVRAAETMQLVLRLSKGDVRLRLGKLARRLGVAPRTVSTAFRKLYGTLPKDFQLKVRVEWICDTIAQNPDRKIDSIAAEAGYNDLSDFTHLFRKHKGMSPSEYRNRLQH